MAPMDPIWLFFSIDVALACHSVALHPPPIFHPYRSANGIGYASKTLKW